ncbi:hypothetical protein M3215_11600 [Bacillus cytotoxicus]|uniref:Uncharacterized protein n=1 Tax=Bacillus cytotoxicus TaxID=580165 RepID=A0ACC6A6D5_9BACI|nr:hypothetical protein [Bacillus cytotoxicus]
MSLKEFYDEMYLSLLKEGYKLHEIDAMDICYYIKLLNKNMEKKEKKRTGYIDQVM